MGTSWAVEYKEHLEISFWTYSSFDKIIGFYKVTGSLLREEILSWSKLFIVIAGSCFFGESIKETSFVKYVKVTLFKSLKH